MLSFCEIRHSLNSGSKLQFHEYSKDHFMSIDDLVFYEKLEEKPCCLLNSLAVLLVACGSSVGTGTTTSSGTSPTATATQATLVPTVTASPTHVVTPPAKLTVAIACGGTKQNGYGVDVIHGKVC